MPGSVYRHAARVVKFALFPLVGLLAIAWFIVRVVPKPARAAYPCQRVAAGLGGGFLAYLLAMIVPAAMLHRLNRRAARLRKPLLVISGVALMAAAVPFLASLGRPDAAMPAFVPADSPNQPFGTARGIHPGRVVWVRDPRATPWDGVNGYWWSDANTRQEVVDAMLSRSLQLVSGATSDASAWDSLFRHFNGASGRGDRGYQAGEKVVVKINSNQDSGQPWDNGGFQSPHLVYSLVKQLLHAAGVDGADITIVDAARYIGDPIVAKIRSDPGAGFQSVHFVVRPDLSGNGRLAAIPDFGHPIRFVKPNADAADIPDHFPPTCFTEATYVVSLSLLRSHELFGATLAGKNFFGAVHNGTKFSPRLLHPFGTAPHLANELGDPHCHPVLFGHEELGGKTLLFLMDGLYTAIHQGSKTITRWQSLDGGYFSSLMASQDPVAIDSVALDFLRSEPSMQIGPLNIHTCNYLHEAARADDPPSGAVYDPEGDGSPLSSLGVHEHWNDATERQYSRNLGTGDGIELVSSVPGISLLSPTGGQSWVIGTNRAVTWAAAGYTGTVRLVLFNGNTKVGAIATGLSAASGSFSWTVGQHSGGTAPAGSNYRIRIVSSDGTLGDWSDAPFAIVPPPSLKLLYPNGGERWLMGNVHTVTWSAADYSGLVRLVLYNGNTKVGAIATGLSAASGSFSWTVGQHSGGTAPAGSNYRIRIVSSDGTLGDWSDAPFAIVPPPSLKLLYPNGGERWLMGNVHTVTWSAADYSGLVRLVLYNGNTKVGAIATGLSATAGSFSWTVGQHSGGTAPAGASYRVRLASNDSVSSDSSDAAFTLF